MFKQKNNDSSGINGSNRSISQSYDLTVSLSDFPTSISANSENVPVNNDEQIWKHSPVGIMLIEPSLKSTLEKNPLLGHYIVTDSPLTKIAYKMITAS